MLAGRPNLGFTAGSPELAIAEARAKLRNDDWQRRECEFNSFDITTQSGCALDIAARLQGFERRVDETDAEFIARIESSVSGTGFVTGLESAIGGVQDVCRVRVFNNTTQSADPLTGNPGGSYEIVYQGGDTSDIARVAWPCSSGAINIGQQTEFFEDAGGICREVRLTEAVEVPQCVRLVIDTYQLRGGCDNQTFDAITDAALAALQSKDINIGDPIFAGTISTGVYAAVGGIDIVSIEFAPSSVDADGNCTCANVQESDWEAGALRLSHRELATFDRDCIVIISRDR